MGTRAGGREGTEVVIKDKCTLNSAPPIYQVTNNIWFGPFASPSRIEALNKIGITHILNVSEAPNVISADNSPFDEIAWHPLEDLTAIAPHKAIELINTLHRMVCSEGANIYVHCIAGKNRSATILWLYLIAAGYSPQLAKSKIELASPDSVPGHSQLVNSDLLEAVQQFSQSRLLPHPRPGAIEWAR
jgi:protein-tyrosine phosphatase